MAGAKLSPRQRMIGMMYLVLTALLALNINKEIIQAFVTINDSVEKSNENLTDRNKQTYSAFELAMKTDQAKTQIHYDRAMKVKVLSDSLVNYMGGIKKQLVVKADGLDPTEKVPELREMQKMDDYDTPTELMVGSEQDGKGHLASALRKRLDEYKQAVLKILDPKDVPLFTKRFDELLNTKDPDPKRVVEGRKTWEMATFYHNPVVASVALLTKMQSDVKNAEAEVTTHLLTNINRMDFKFSKLEPKVIAPTSYVFVGDEYKADVFLAAVNETSSPEISVGGRVIPVESGMGKYTDRPGSSGLKKWGGVIKVKKPDNTFDEYKFESEYIAAPPAAVVSPTKMNVLYIGVDNPISISVPGVPNEKVKPSIAGGGAVLSRDPQSKGSSDFLAKVTTPGEATLTVNADFDGRNRTMGTMKFRIKNIPDPVGMIANSKGGPMNKNTLAAQPSVFAVLENFAFDLKFSVTKFSMYMQRKGKDPINLESTNNLITPQMKEMLQSATAGTKVVFENIRAVGPDGKTRSLGAISFTLQ